MLLMITEDLMRSKVLIIIIFGLILFIQGCATFKGAKEGVKKDWKSLGKVDDWIQENMW